MANKLVASFFISCLVFLTCPHLVTIFFMTTLLASSPYYPVTLVDKSFEHIQQAEVYLEKTHDFHWIVSKFQEQKNTLYKFLLGT
jgi:hypothetical protein